MRATAAWAGDAIGPTARDEIIGAGFLVRKHPFELTDGHLMNGLRALGHGGAPYQPEAVWH